MKPDNRVPPFFDGSRIAIVDGLLDIVDSVNKSGTAKWISIEAPSGWGKTRLVQELYKRLAAKQEKQYWPPSILQTSSSYKNDVMSRRKRVFPNPDLFEREAGALPAFMWLGFACELRNGVPSQVLLEDLEQLKAHTIYLEASWSALASFKEKRFPSLAQAKQAVSDVIDETISHSAGKIIEEIGNATVPGMGLLVKLGRIGFDKTKESSQIKKNISSAGAIEIKSNTPDLIMETVSIIAKLSKPGLPTIVFVEDLHKATPLMEKLIDKLIRLDASVIIITSTWPGELEKRDILKAPLIEDGLKSRIIRIQHEQPLSSTFFTDEASMSPLSDDSMRGIIKSYFLKVDEKTLELLAKRYNNPLPLELVCSLPVYAKNFPDGDLCLTEKEIEGLPPTVHKLYVELWEALPEHVQQTLIIATLAIPFGHHDWDNELLMRVLKDTEDYQDIALMLEAENITHGWTRDIEYWLKRFNEPDQMKVALDFIDENFRPHEIEGLISSLVSNLCKKRLDIETHSKQDQHAAWMILTLHKRNLIADHDVVLVAIRVLQEELRLFPLEYPIILGFGEQLDQLTDVKNKEELLKGRVVNALVLSKLGKIKDALEESKNILRDNISMFGADAPEILKIRNNIAYYLAKSGDVYAALEKFNALLGDQIRVLGPDAPDILKTRNNIANALGKRGDVETALAKFNALLRDHVRVLGPDAPETLEIRNNIANALGKRGDVETALEKFKALLRDQVRVLGHDAPQTLITRNHIAIMSHENGELNDVSEQLYKLLGDQIRLLGADAPKTLVTRNNIAHLLADSGDVYEALKQFNDLLDDQLRVLDSDAPDILVTRRDISFCLYKIGDVEGALKHLFIILGDQIRMFGSDAPATEKTRNDIMNLMSY
ncbi:MAG: tetratricopeptide (TPR) repeat protein [Paraglaciecola sp.]|jgi:tetratricopeptide (TPR) repeat protein